MGCGCSKTRAATASLGLSSRRTSPIRAAITVETPTAKTRTAWTVTSGDGTSTFYTLFEARAFARSNGGVIETIKIPI